MTNLIAPESIDIFRVAQLRGQCRIIGAGMTIRGLTKRALVERVAQYTGMVKRGASTVGALLAADDCTAWLAIHNPAPQSPAIGRGDVRHA